MEEHIVQYGDTLIIIAAKKLNDKNRWMEIAQLNKLQNPNKLLIGQLLRLPTSQIQAQPNVVPNQPINALPNLSNQQIPASVIPARGFMFVVFEQLPEVGSKNVIRKVAVIPKDFSLFAPNPSANLSPAEHALGNNASQFLSSSDKPFGSPTMSKASPINPGGWKELLLIDTGKVQATGTRIMTVDELVADLRRYAVDNPQSAQRVKTLIRTVQNVEGEVLIDGGVPGDAVKKVSSAHTNYIQTADEIWARRVSGEISLKQAESELASLAKAYEKAKIVGRVGRVLTVVAVVFTAVDVANAAQKSYDKRSYKPLAAETVRQIGGWSGAYAGGVFGAGAGALFGIETGPGAILFAAGGAIIFGAIGYWRGDIIAGWIESDESSSELRKDVRSTDGMKTKGIKLIVGQNETQYDFCRRALLQAALVAQLFSPSERNTFIEAFYPLNKSIEEKLKIKANWVSGDPNPRDGSDIKSAEWEKLKGTEMTYYLNDAEIKELVRRLLNR